MLEWDEFVGFIIENGTAKESESQDQSGQERPCVSPYSYNPLIQVDMTRYTTRTLISHHRKVLVST